MLMGIIARGTAFSFRNYDAVKDEMQIVYSRIFVYASIITPLFLGIIAGSIVSGKIDPAANSFMDVYIYDWLNWFPLSVGLFTVLHLWISCIRLSHWGIRHSGTKTTFFQKNKKYECGSFYIRSSCANCCPYRKYSTLSLAIWKSR